MFGTFPVIRFSQFAAVLLTVGLVTFPGCRTLSPRHSPTPTVQPPVFHQPNMLDASDQYSAFRPVMPEVFTPPTLTPPAFTPSTSTPPTLTSPAFTPPMIVQEPPRVEPLRNESPPEIIASAAQPDQSTAQEKIAQEKAAQSKIDELNQRIEELETRLAEQLAAQLTEQLEGAQEAARREPPPVHSIESPLIGSPLFDVPPVGVAPDVPLVDTPLADTPQIGQTEVRTTRRLPIINRGGVNLYTDESQNVRIEIADRFLFMPNAWQLTAEGEETLRVIAAELRAFDPTSFLDIEGHTDSLMGDPNNPMQKHEISSIKTNVVMNFFVNALRWDAARIGTSSFGRSRPIADNGTPEGRARNNRIEMVIREGRE